MNYKQIAVKMTHKKIANVFMAISTLELIVSLLSNTTKNPDERLCNVSDMNRVNRGLVAKHVMLLGTASIIFLYSLIKAPIKVFRLYSQKLQMKCEDDVINIQRDFRALMKECFLGCSLCCMSMCRPFFPFLFDQYDPRDTEDYFVVLNIVQFGLVCNYRF